jgi:hypothetical protein
MGSISAQTKKNPLQTKENLGLNASSQNQVPVGEIYQTVEISTNILTTRIQELQATRQSVQNPSQALQNELGVKYALYQTTLDALNGGKTVERSLADGLGASMDLSIQLGFSTQTTGTFFTALNDELQQ